MKALSGIERMKVDNFASREYTKCLSTGQHKGWSNIENAWQHAIYRFISTGVKWVGLC